jgi:hypothetical protein
VVSVTRRLISSEFGMRVSEGLRRSAEDRKCPECGRHGALVEADVEWVRDDIIRVGVICRWARDSDGRLCAYQSLTERPLLPHERPGGTR